MILEGEIGPWGPIVVVQVRARNGTETGNAIMDSGARLSVVDEGAAKRAGGIIVGSHKAKGVCGTCDMKIHRVELILGGVTFSDADLLGKPGLEPFIALLGQDFLSQGLLVCDGPKKRYRFTTT